MDILLLVFIGCCTGVTTVLFGFGGGFVAVPTIIWIDSALGVDAAVVAVATSSIVMAVTATFATLTLPDILRQQLRRGGCVLALLGLGGVAGALMSLTLPGTVASWGFVAYVALTLADIFLRPGFFRQAASPGSLRTAIPPSLCVPIGAIAAFLGVGGSIMTVPLLRRGGYPMQDAATLANPLTLAVSLPAGSVFLAFSGLSTHSSDRVLVGSVDVVAAMSLLAGALPVIVTLRIKPPRIPDRVHTWAYIALLVGVLIAMIWQLV